MLVLAPDPDRARLGLLLGVCLFGTVAPANPAPDIGIVVVGSNRDAMSTASKVRLDELGSSGQIGLISTEVIEYCDPLRILSAIENFTAKAPQGSCLSDTAVTLRCSRIRAGVPRVVWWSSDAGVSTIPENIVLFQLPSFDRSKLREPWKSQPI